MHSPTVSVVIPVYDDFATLDRSIRSVIAQTYPVSEIVVVDDGSPERINVQSLSDRVPIRILKHETNRGPSAARNSGIRTSSGDYVAFLDADDTWRPTKIALQMDLLARADRRVAACVGGFALHREESAVIEDHYVSFPKSFIDELMFGCKISPGSTLVVRRNCYDTVGLYDEELRRLEDWDWLLRFAATYGIVSVPSILSDIYVSTRSAATQLMQVSPALERIRAKHIQRISGLGVTKRCQFVSTIYVEEAAARYRADRRVSAMAFAVGSMMIWPFKDAKFFARVLRIVRNVVVRAWAR